MAFGTLLSGRVKKKSGLDLDSNRYSYISLDNAEPDFGLPSTEHSLITSLTDGTRSFAGLGTGLVYDSATDTIKVDETTLEVDTSGLSYSNSSTLSGVLEDLDSDLVIIQQSLDNIVTSVSTDNTIDGDGLPENPLSIGQRVDSDASVVFRELSIDELTFDTEHVHTGPTPPGHLDWNPADGTLNLRLTGGNATLQVGQEQVYYVKNVTGSTIPDGTVVGATGAQGGRITVAPYIADGTFLPEQIVGITTEAIEDDADGYVTNFGYVRDLDTRGFTVGSILYASPDSAGRFTSTPPISPDLKVIVGLVTEEDSAGSVYSRPSFTPVASDVTYNNTESGLVASNVQTAIDELNVTKADLTLLSSNVTLYSTSDSADVPGYFVLASSQDDSSYDTVAVDIPTGVIDSDNMLLASLVSDTNLFTGTIAGISVTTIGNIEKTAGGFFQGASFYFEVYKRDSADNEVLIGTSGTTDEITNTSGYEQFFESALIQNGPNSIFTSEDRVVLKFYGNNANGGSPEFQFQFGGSQPVRTLFPVPVSVLPAADGTGILLDTSNFNGKLNATTDTTQKAFDALDDHVHTTSEITEGSRLYYTTARANSAIDARVTKSFVDALNVDADTLDNLNSTDFTLDRVTDNGATTTNDITVGGVSIGSTVKYEGASATLATVTESPIAEFASATFDGAKMIVTATRGTDRHMSELLVTHDGTTAVATEYGVVTTNGVLASYDVDISGGNVRLLATGTSATSTVYNTALILTL